MVGQNLGTIPEITSVLHMFSQVISKKVNITLTIRLELKELAEKFEINLSALLEDALIQRLRDLILIKQGENLMLRPGFEPGSRDRESRMIGRATPPELGIFFKASVFKNFGGTVDSAGFEPAASALRRRRSTRLSYEPTIAIVADRYLNFAEELFYIFHSNFEHDQGERLGKTSRLRLQGRAE